MIVSELAEPTLAARLRSGGLRIRTGPLVIGIESALADVRAGVRLHYAQHTVEAVDDFVDFHVRVDRPRALHRWTKPRARFLHDGAELAPPLDGHDGFAALERGLNRCLSTHCHQYLILRAAVLERGGRALILPAPSGSGTSTLCAALAFAGGWRLLCDELALIDASTGQAVALPRPVRLQNDSIDLIRRFAPDAVLGPGVREVDCGVVAYARPPAESLLRARERALPAWLVVPRYIGGAATQLDPLPRARGFMALVDNALNYDVHGRSGFATLAGLIERSACHDFTYSSLPEAVTTFDRLVKSG